MMNQAAVVALFCAVLCSYYAPCVAYKYEDCGSTLGKFTDISVTNCNVSNERCILKRGTNATISIKFIPNEDIPQVGVRVYGVMLDVPIPFPLGKPDACKDPDCGFKCPLEKDQEYEYTTTMFVQNNYPSVSVNIEWKLIDANARNIVCILFPAKLASTLI